MQRFVWCESHLPNTFINSKANVDFDNFEFELGYISTSINFRGQKLASKLCKELCALYSNHNIFSTTRIDNEPMKSILSQNNFKEIGNEFLKPFKYGNKNESIDGFHNVIT